MKKMHFLKGRAIHLPFKKHCSHFQLLSHSCSLHDFGRLFSALTSLAAQNHSLRKLIICVRYLIYSRDAKHFFMWWLYGVKDERKVETSKEGKMVKLIHIKIMQFILFLVLTSLMIWTWNLYYYNKEKMLWTLR